jgi:hypothetical protein
MGLSVSLDTGRIACVESIDSFVRAVETLGEYELLGASRCHGWTRLDVVVHVLGGWHEMLGGLASSVDSPPSVDAATYWTAFATQYAGDDPVEVLMEQHRRTAAYARPAAATAHLLDVAAAVRRGVIAFQDQPRLWDGHVFTAGDYLAIWAVEDVVHQLDLRCDEPEAASALEVARATIEALVGERLPAAWTDRDVTLVGTGRLPVPDGTGAATAARLPVLG